MSSMIHSDCVSVCVIYLHWVVWGKCSLEIKSLLNFFSVRLCALVLLMIFIHKRQKNFFFFVLLCLVGNRSASARSLPLTESSFFLQSTQFSRDLRCKYDIFIWIFMLSLNDLQSSSSSSFHTRIIELFIIFCPKFKTINRHCWQVVGANYSDYYFSMQ